MAQGTTKGIPIDTDPTLSANSDALVSSQKAVKTYVDNNVASLETNKVTKGGDADGTILTVGTTDNNNVDIITNNSIGLTISTDRYVGIRKSDPKSPLHIFGNGANGANAYIFFGDSFINTTTPYVAIGEANGTDSDSLELYGKNAMYIRVNSFGSTSAIFISGAAGSSGYIHLGGEAPTAKLHLQACSAGANNSSLKIPAGTLSTASDGAVDYNGSNYFACVGTTRFQLARCLTGSATLDFPSTAAGAVSDLTITVTGAATGDCVAIGVPNGSLTATATFWGWVSAANTVTIRYSPKAIENPPSGTFKVTVFKNI